MARGRAARPRSARCGVPVSEETTDTDGAFPRLDDGQLETLARFGTTRATHPGEVLYRAGHTTADFFAITGGTVAQLEDFGGERRVLARHGRGRFLGDIGLLTGQPML